MRYLALTSVLYALAVHAAPAPQTDDAAADMPTLEGPEGFCSSAGEYWNGVSYVECGLGRYCRENVCGFETTPLPAGVSGPAVTAATAQPTEMAAGADAPAVTAATEQPTELAADADAPAASDQATTAVAVTDVDAMESPTSSATTNVVAEASSLGVSVVNKAVEPSGITIQAGADTSSVISGVTTNVAPSASGVTSAQATIETGTSAGALIDSTCVDDRPADVARLLALKTSPDYEWKMTGKECKPRANADTAPRFVAYWSQWSNSDTPPTAEQLAGVTHLIYSFAASNGSDWTPQDASKPNPFNNTAEIDKLKADNPGMKVLAAFGGWNLDPGFAEAADTGDMSSLAARIVKFRGDNHLDGIDIDWEYPVGGGAYYKSCSITTQDHKLPERPYERDALVDLLRHVRDLDPEVHISIAVPARTADRELSFPKDTIKEMDPCLDNWNLMTYDMMNRRDLTTAHHAGSAVIKDVVDYYSMDGVVDKKKMNIGFALYAKYFTLSDPKKCTSQGGLGCAIKPAEGPAGQDLGISGAWVFNQAQNVLWSENDAVKHTFKLAKSSWDLLQQKTDTEDAKAGASSWADGANQMFWTWTSPKDIEQSCAQHMKDVGGVMVWSINQDENGTAGGPHMKAIAGCLGGTSASDNAATSASASDQTSVDAGATSNPAAPVTSAQ